MPNNSILFEVVVTDKGLQVVEKKLDGVTQATNRAAASTEKLSRTQKNSSAGYNKQQKGVAQATSNSTKAFSKQAQFIQGGLVPAYAEIASRVFAITAFFGALQRAAQFERLAAGIETLGTSSGIALTTLSEGLQKATGFALSMEEAMRSTNLVISAGFGADSIERLGEVARTASIALGRDTADSLSRLTRGATKLEPELLDELGIMVRLDEATEKYASQIGKTVSQLTNFERRQAFMNAVLEEGESKFGALSDVDVSAYDKLSASFADLSKSLLNIVNVALKPLVTVLTESKALLLGVFTIFGATVLKSIAPGLSDLANRYDNLRAAQSSQTLGTIKSLSVIKNTGPAFDQAIEIIEKGGDSIEAYGKAMASIRGRLGANTRELNKLNPNLAENKEIIERLERENEGLRRSYSTLNKELQQTTRYTNLLNQEQQVATLITSGRWSESLREGKNLLSGFKDNFKEAGKSSSGFTKVFDKVGSVFGSAASAGRLFGTVISSFIPIVGAVTTIIGILTTAVGFLRSMFYLAVPSAKAYAEALEELESAAEEASKTFEQLNLAAEGNSKIFKDIITQNNAASNAYENLISKTEKANAALKKNESYVGFRDVLENTLLTIKASDELSGKFEEVYGKSVTDALISAVYNVKNWNEAVEMTEDIVKNVLTPVKNFRTSLNQFSKSAAVASEANRDLFNSLKGKSPYDQAISDVKDLGKNLKNLTPTTSNYRTVLQTLKETADKESLDFLGPDVVNQIKNGEAISVAAIKAIVKALMEETEAALEFLETQRTIKIFQEGTKAELAAQQQLLELQGFTEKGLIEYQSKRVNILAAEKALKEAQLEDGVRAIARAREQGESEAVILGMIAQQNALRAEIAVIEENLKPAQAKVEEEKKILEALKEQQELRKSVLDVQQQFINAQKKQNDLIDKAAIATNRLKNAQAGLKSGETANQAFDRFSQNFELGKNKDDVQLNEDRRNLLKEEQRIKTALVEMEVDMLKQEWQLLAARVEADGTISEERKKNLRGILKQGLDNIEGEEGLRARLRQNVEREAALAEQELLIEYFDKRNAAEKELRDNRLAAAQLENDLAKELLDLNDRILKDKMSVIDSQRKVEEERLRVQNAATRIDGKRVLTAQQIAKLDEETREKKEALIKQETKNKLEALKLEFQLLRAKREIQKAEAELLVEQVRLTLGDARADSLKQGIDASFEASGKLLDMAEASARERIKALGESLIADLESAARDSVEKAGAKNFLANTDTYKFLQETEDAIARGVKGITTAEDNRTTANNSVLGAAGALDEARSNFASAEEIAKLEEELATAEARARDAGKSVKQAFINATLEGIQPMLNKLRELGPNGELVAAISEGTLVMASAFIELSKETNTAADKIAAVGAIVSSVGSIMNAASEARIAGIDKEIEAEKKRDGKSKESLSKIQALEKKKDRAKRKQFEQNKKISMAEAVIQGSLAIVKALAEGGPILGPILAAAIGALTAAQLAIISSTTYQGGSSSGGTSVSSNISVGERSNRVDVANKATGSELSGLRGGNTANVGGQNMMPPPAFMGAKYRAQGGPTAGYVVGEQGPELFVPEVPGRIVPNDEMKQAQPLNVNFNVQAIDASSFNDALITQRGNIISMIREAANTYGETFLEGVNDVAISSGRGKV